MVRTHRGREVDADGSLGSTSRVPTFYMLAPCVGKGAPFIAAFRLPSDVEFDQRGRTERSADRNIGSVSPTCHQYPTCSSHVIAGIEGLPAPADIGFEP